MGSFNDANSCWLETTPNVIGIEGLIPLAGIIPLSELIQYTVAGAFESLSATIDGLLELTAVDVTRSWWRFADESEFSWGSSSLNLGNVNIDGGLVSENDALSPFV